MLRFKRFNPFTKIFFLTIIFNLMNYSCNDDAVTPPEDTTARRDYNWTADTLWADDWFGITDVWSDSPNSIWLTALGTSSKDCLWHYDGTKWSESNQRLNPSLNTVFGINSDEIWIGDSYGGIWRNTGSGWQKFKELTIDGYDRIIIASIYGTSKNNLYAVGAADNYDGSGYKGLILRYDGHDWIILNIPDIRVGFDKIRKTSDNQYIISAMNSDNGFLYKLYIFDGASILKEIYSDDLYPGLNKMNDEVYITINMKIYKCRNEILEIWKEFPNTNYSNTVLGRNERDFFGSSYNDLLQYSDGILHFNGNDIVNIYQTDFNGLSGWLIFDKDVFFGGYTFNNLNVMIRGILK